MNASRLALYVALLLMVLGVYVVIRNPLVVAISAIVAAVVAYFVSRGGGPAASAPVTAPEGELPEWVGHLRDLVKLDSVIREHACPEPVVAKLEENIDVLRRLMPELNESYVGSELTWTVNRMATDYLSRIVRPYLELSAAARAENQQELLGSLAGLEAELENIEGLVRNAKEGDFKTKAAFLRARFLDDKL